MVAIRCTKKLLAHVGPPQEVSEPATTILGDWYGQPLAIGHQRLALLISEYSRLPVLMAGRDLKHLAANFPDALAAVLWGLGIDAEAIQGEVAATRAAVIARTNSRSHLGTLNDFSSGRTARPDRPRLVRGGRALGSGPGGVARRRLRDCLPSRALLSRLPRTLSGLWLVGVSGLCCGGRAPHGSLS